MEADDETKVDSMNNDQPKKTSSSKSSHGALPEIKDYKKSEEFKE
jgi:hypothetical protein